MPIEALLAMYGYNENDNGGGSGAEASEEENENEEELDTTNPEDAVVSESFLVGYSNRVLRPLGSRWIFFLI